jgi:hypothetical protein
LQRSVSKRRDHSSAAAALDRRTISSKHFRREAFDPKAGCRANRPAEHRAARQEKGNSLAEGRASRARPKPSEPPWLTFSELEEATKPYHDLDLLKR